MPRPNPPRAVFAEANLARRVGIERERHGFTYERLAEELKNVGCSIQVSALHKIEKGDPPRRITVDELVAFSKVFDLPMNDLVADTTTLLPARAFDLRERTEIALAAAFSAKRAWDRLFKEWVDRMDEYTKFVEAHPEVARALKDLQGAPEQEAAKEKLQDLEHEEALTKAFQEASRKLRTTQTE